MLAAVRDARAAIRADPATAAPVIAGLEDRGRAALTEMRSLLGVLRRGDEDLALAPIPSLARLEALAARHACGLRVEGPPRPVSPGLDVAAYRVVESALERAASAHDVVLRWTPRAVEVEVAADGPQLAEPDAALGELVGLFDGRVSAGRRPRGGSALRAALPTEGVR
jgi:signal transduction histidine kinase